MDPKEIKYCISIVFLIDCLITRGMMDYKEMVDHLEKLEQL